jgi:hypothetical protein
LSYTTFDDDPYVINAVSEIIKTSSDLSLDEMPKVLAQLRADGPAKRRFLARMQQHHRPKVRFCWDAERQAVCLRAAGGQMT